jgi:perosamine synthetase
MSNPFDRFPEANASGNELFEPNAAIPLCVPEIGGNARAYVKECLDTGSVGPIGDYVDRFERDLAANIGVRHAIATVNGSAALHIALRVAGVEPEDEALVPALASITTANAIRYCGAWPVFIDSESTYGQMDVERVEEFLQRECLATRRGPRNRQTGRRVKAVVPVHLLGHPVDMDPLLELARRHNLQVIEEVGVSLGARYRGRPVGSLGDLACFSFHVGQLITTGAGGMLVTDNKALDRQARHLTTQAMTDLDERTQDIVGYNFRLTNLLAALGCAQLEQLEARLDARRHLAIRYHTGLQDLPGVFLLPTAEWAESACGPTTIRVDETVYGLNCAALQRRLNAVGIQTRPLRQPLHLSPAYQDCPAADCPVAERFYAECLTLPYSVGLTVADQDRVLAAIKQAVGSPKVIWGPRE